MKRWLSKLTIVCYLSTLAFGIFSHTLSYKNVSHPFMYYIVWDMFCGWSAHDTRVHIISEGESGKYYELTPAPWGELTPYGSIGRRHYDMWAQFGYQFAHNTLAHTRHEPMTRIFVIEESWAKKYNMPDWLWNQRYDEPKDPKMYYHVRQVMDANGSMLVNQPSWLAMQAHASISRNPRLQTDMQRNRPFYALDPRNNSYGAIMLQEFDQPAGNPPLGSLLGQ